SPPRCSIGSSRSSRKPTRRRRAATAARASGSPSAEASSTCSAGPWPFGARSAAARHSSVACPSRHAPTRRPPRRRHPTSRGCAQQLEADGFAVHLLKPVRPSQLMESIAIAWAARASDNSSLVTRQGLSGSVSKPASNAGRPLRLSHVLLAEDNVVNQEVAAGMLERLGCRVDIVANGQEVLDRLAHRDYDVVFMDC